MRLRPFAVAGALAIWCGLAAEAAGQAIKLERVEEIPALLDTLVPKLMAEQHVPGTAVVVVHDGRVTFLRGYGKSRLDAPGEVDPARTLFRIGSVTKLFTAVAALQLVDEGTLDLERDVASYLPGIALRYGATAHQLLTHTAGFDHRFAGSATDRPEQIQALAAHLPRSMPVQFTPPGSVYAYSNYSYALVGLLVEKLSGLRYEDYLAARIFAPLGMAVTTAHQPVQVSDSTDLARGYRWTGSRQEPLTFTYVNAGPSGGVSASAADMGRFLLALLGDGSLDGVRLLSADSLTRVLTPQYAPDAHIPGVTYGLVQWLTHGQQLLHKDGTLGDQIGMVMLAPADKFGIFVASNALPGAANLVLEPLLTHLLGPAARTPPATPLADAPSRAPRVAGVYRNYMHTRNEMSRIRALMPMIQSRVSVEADGAIRWRGSRWLEVEPLVFRGENSLDHLVFREDGSGNVTQLSTWGGSYQRIPWWEQTPFHVGVFVCCVAAFLAYPLSRGIRRSPRPPAPAGGRMARPLAVAVALTHLVFVMGLAFALRDLGSVTPLPWTVAAWLSLPVLALALTALLPYFAARAWWAHWWTRRERLTYSMFVVCALGFLAFLNYWKLLGIRY